MIEKTQVLFSRSAYGTDKPHISKQKDNITEKTQVLHSFSAYETREPHISNQKDNTYQYPCVYMCLKDGTIKCWWSNCNDKGFFGVPKVIWSNGVSSVHTDPTGQYGLTQFAFAIVDEPENLENIKKAMENKRFKKLMDHCSIRTAEKYNHQVISLFRKDFYKDFIND